MFTRNLSCIMMMILNLIDRRGGFVEYLYANNHHFTSKNYHLRHCFCCAILSSKHLSSLFLRSSTYNYNSMSTLTSYDYKMFYVLFYTFIIPMKRAFSFFGYICSCINMTWQHIQISYSK